jgi:hypothetical protein
MGKKLPKLGEMYGRAVYGNSTNSLITDAIEQGERDALDGNYVTLNELQRERDVTEAEKALRDGDLAPLSLRQRRILEGKLACSEVRFVPLDRSIWDQTRGGRTPEMPEGEETEIDQRQEQYLKLYDEVSSELPNHQPFEIAIIVANILDLPSQEVAGTSHIRITIPEHAFIDYPAEPI